MLSRVLRAAACGSCAMAWGGGKAAWLRRGVRLGARAGSGEGSLPTVEEAMAGAEAYDGPGIVDPTYMHPNTYPFLHEWTAETFEADLETGGYAEWTIPSEAFVFLRFVRGDETGKRLRQALHLDHLFWARESGIKADRDAAAGTESSRVYGAQALRDATGSDVVASLVTVVGGDEAAARALVAEDPLVRSGCFDEARSAAFHWTIADDPYLQAEVWPEDSQPFVHLRLDDAAGTRKRAETREKHLSFLRKTRRTMRAGPLRPLGGGDPMGSLVYAFHETAAAAEDWAAADPYVAAGVFTAAPLVSTTYCDLDVTGTQITRPPPMNELPDPLLARLVDAKLVTLEERHVERIDLDEATGEFVRYNITTTDPRVLSNVDVDDEMMTKFASTPKALRAKKAREKLKALDEEEELAALSTAPEPDEPMDDDTDLDLSPIADNKADTI